MRKRCKYVLGSAAAASGRGDAGVRRGRLRRQRRTSSSTERQQTTGSGQSLERSEKARGEGKLNLIEWPYYSDPSFAKKFEKQTGCTIQRKDGASSSNEMVSLMRAGGGGGGGSGISFGLRRREPAPDQGRRRPAGQRQLIPD